LDNHARDLISVDFFTVPTATFRVLYVFVVLSHERRQIIHINVTGHPTAEWTARQLVEACGEDNTPSYLIRDRDGNYGHRFRQQAISLGIEEILTAPHSPWQNAFAERVIGSIRRECLNHVVILNEKHLRRILAGYINYYNATRTHLSLNKDAPKGRVVQLPGKGKVVELPRVGGLHHEYTRMAA
jgi:transposase InsO family protein